MKILHTADWHLGKKLEKFSRLEEQQAVMEEICQIADEQAVDIVLIAGDLYDSFNPSNEAIELFYKTLKRLSKNGTRPVIAIAGNHDSPERIEAPDPLAKECGILLTGFPHTEPKPFSLDTGLTLSRSDSGFIELQIPGQSVPLRIITTPYANEMRMKTYLGEKDSEMELQKLLQEQWQNLAATYCDDKGINILMTHLFVANSPDSDLPPEPDGEKPILYVGGASVIYADSFPKQMQYVALGHLHRKQYIRQKPYPVAYSGSPLTYSFAEAGQTKQVIIVEVEAGQNTPKTTDISLKSGKPLIRKAFDNIDNAVNWLNDHPECWVELTIKSDVHLSGADNRRLYSAHSGIVHLIPDIQNQVSESDLMLDKNELDLSNKEELFQKYFMYKYGQLPNENIMQLFKEVLATE